MLAKVEGPTGDQSNTAKVQGMTTILGRHGCQAAGFELGRSRFRNPASNDARAEALRIATTLHGESLTVEGAVHYPHAELPDLVAPRILSFIKGLKI
jgi:hypothetical protein